MQSRFNPVPLPGSEHAPIIGEPAYALGNLAPIRVTVYLKPTATNVQYEEIRVFANAHPGLAVTRTDPKTRTATLVGQLDVMADAFEVHLSHMVNPRTRHQARIQTGPVHVPASLAPHTIAVLGLDHRTAAHPRFCLLPKDAVAANGAVRPFAVEEVASLYQFPTDLD